MSIKKFIEDRKTPYSEIQHIEISGDFVSYTEKCNLNHPDCPIISLSIDGGRLIYVSIVKKLHKEYFEMLYGSIEPEVKKNQNTMEFTKND